MFCLYKDETRAFSCLEDRLLQIAGMLCKGLNSSNRVKNIPNSLLVGGGFGQHHAGMGWRWEGDKQKAIFSLSFYF